jgi:membrane protease YdiL (CAAX protease family)
MLGVRRASPWSWLGAALLGCSFWYVNLLTFAPIANRYLGGRELVRTMDESILNSGAPMWLTIVVIAGFPGVCEELLLRGGIARAFEKRWGPTVAIIGSSLLFGFMHLHPAQMLTTAAFGVVLGYATLSSGSVLPAMLIHILNNALVLVVAGEISPPFTETLRASPLMWGAISGFLCVCGSLLLFRGRFRRSVNPIPEPS